MNRAFPNHLEIDDVRILELRAKASDEHTLPFSWRESRRGRGESSYALSGSQIVNVLPWPSSLSTEISPPCSVTISFTT